MILIQCKRSSWFRWFRWFSWLGGKGCPGGDPMEMMSKLFSGMVDPTSTKNAKVKKEVKEDVKNVSRRLQIKK